ncbi:MAG: aliphatic sulfonate transporter substrate-binding protein [Rhizorhabdus sp.]|nr:aliphatic sulfonate transporter substrate-binding protein [Rhizorhabdus sp.]
MTDMITRRSTLGLFASLATLAACGRSGSSDVLRVGSQRGGTKAMMLASGVLDKAPPYAIEWSEFAAAQPLLEALAAGAVDLGMVGDAPFLFAYQGGGPIKSVQAIRYEPRNAANAILVPNASPLRSLADLRGKRVATGRGSIGHFFLLRALEKAGVPASAVDIVFLPPGDAKAAFASGSIDAWSTWNPYVGSTVLHKAGRVLAEGRGLFDGYGFLVANARSIADKRALLTDFLPRHARAERWASDNTKAFGALLAKETGLPADDALYFADRNIIPLATDAALIRTQEGVLRTFLDAGATKAGRPLADAFDTSFDSLLG